MLTDAPSDSEAVGVAVVVLLKLDEELKLLDTLVVLDTVELPDKVIDTDRDGVKLNDTLPLFDQELLEDGVSV